MLERCREIRSSYTVRMKMVVTVGKSDILLKNKITTIQLDSYILGDKFPEKEQVTQIYKQILRAVLFGAVQNRK